MRDWHIAIDAPDSLLNRGRQRRSVRIRTDDDAHIRLPRMLAGKELRILQERNVDLVVERPGPIRLFDIPRHSDDRPPARLPGIQADPFPDGVFMGPDGLRESFVDDRHEW